VRIGSSLSGGGAGPFPIPYMAQEADVDTQLESMIRNLKEKTGRSLDDWAALVRESGLEKHGQQVKLLKEEHGLTHGYANLVVTVARSGLPEPRPTGAEADADADASLFAGKKEGLRPIWDVLRAELLGLGPDVELAPKKAYVSVRRLKQLALVQPSTATRLDLGLVLKGVEPTERLEAAGSFNAMCTHRVRLESPDDVDAEVMGWVREAYERAG
jgi:predicted transport protein